MSRRPPERVRPGPPVEALLLALLAGQRALAAEQARHGQVLAAVLRALERGRGARDGADLALLRAVAEALGDRPFTSADLIAHAPADEALREALAAADITGAQELGCLFRRLDGSDLAGLRLTRVADGRRGIVWQVQVGGD